MSATEQPRQCSFCLRTQAEDRKLVSTPGAKPGTYICDACLAGCTAALRASETHVPGSPNNE